jgi:hypothetical protein
MPTDFRRRGGELAGRELRKFCEGRPPAEPVAFIAMAATQATQNEAAEKAAIDSDGLPAGERLSLEELTRIMDVATTLRKERAIVEQQLNNDQIKAKLRERLLEAAKVSGDAVTEAEVDAAVDQYYDRLHEFREPPASFTKFLAHLWVLRTRLVKWLIGIVGVVAAVAAFSMVQGARQNAAVNNLYDQAVQHQSAILTWDEAESLKAEVEALVSAAEAARRNGDAAELTRINQELAALDRAFATQYEVTILSSPDERSGTERIWNDDQGSRTSGFFVFVTARDDEGRNVEVTVHDRETDATKTVTRWGEQVPEAVFDRLLEDKQADGVLDEREFAVKHRGTRELEIVLKGEDGQPIQRGGQITSW